MNSPDEIAPRIDQNRVIELATTFWDLDSPGSTDKFIHAFTELSNTARDGFLSAITESEIEQAHSTAHDLLARGAIHAAAIIAGVNLLVASQCKLPQWTEWSMGLLCRCCVAALGDPETDILAAFVDELRSRYDYKYDPRPELGLSALTGNLCEVLATEKKGSRRRELLKRSVEAFRHAYHLAESIRADARQIAAIRMSLASDLLSLFVLSGNAEIGLLEESLLHLAHSREFFLHLPGATMELVQIGQQLARAHRAAAENIDIFLNEPAFPADNRLEALTLWRSNARAAVHYGHATIKLLPPDHPRAQLLTSSLLDDLSDDLQELSRHCHPHSYRLRQIAQSYARQAAAFWEASEMRQRCISSLLNVAQVSKHLLVDHGDGTYEEVIRVYQKALDLATESQDAWLVWRAAGLFAHFVASCPHAGEKKEVDWSKAHDLFDLACRNLVGCAGMAGESIDHVTMLRQSTRWFWEHAVQAAAKSGELHAIPRTLEAQRALSSINRPLTPSEVDVSWSELSALLPHSQATLVYVLQGSDSLQAVVVHSDQAMPDDYIQAGTSWEAVRQIVDPWIAANQRLRDSNASTTREACSLALEQMLAGLFPLIWQEIDARLQQIGATQVFLVRGRGLQIIPIHALQRGDGTAVLDRYSLTYLQSGRMISNPVCPPFSEAKLLAVANPTLDLPYTEPEVRLVAARFPCLSRAVLRRRKATIRSVNAAIGQADYVHFACHGQYDVQLRGVYTRGTGQLVLADGNLELDELQLMHLSNAPIVVLSACETGRSDWRDLESLGIADYFLSSGARAVVATLWTVDDFATALLIEDLYDRIRNGARLDEALQHAQAWLRDIDAGSVNRFLRRRRISRSLAAEALEVAQSHLDVQRPFASPYYWAPFYLVVGSRQA